MVTAQPAAEQQSDRSSDDDTRMQLELTSLCQGKNNQNINEGEATVLFTIGAWLIHMEGMMEIEIHHLANSIIVIVVGQVVNEC